MATVEPPLNPEPEDEDTERRGRHVVAGDGSCLAVLVILADARSEHPRAEHRDEAADVVNLRGSGKIMESEIGKPAAAPAPVPADRIDEQRDHRGVHAVRLEIGALSHRTGDDRRRRRAEHRLENDVAPERHGLRNNAVLGGVAAVDEEVRRADESAESAVEHQREADEPETGSTDAEVHHILHQNISRVLGSRQACLTECKSGLHEVDQS